MSTSCVPTQGGPPALEVAAALALLDTVRHAIVFVDNEHIIRYLNRAAEQKYYVERRLANLVGQSILDCHRKDESRKEIVALHARLRAGENEVFMKINKRGETVTVVGVRGRDGTLLGYYERVEMAAVPGGAEWE